jgi:hypothetical protein
MDDFNVGSLHESKNEWGARLLTIVTPLIIEGFKSIFEEANKLCRENNETEKYLMTFQNFVSRIPKWNPTIIENERKRICDRSGCGYLEDLVTCVHIIQLKLLTAMRAGNKQKKIDINIPKLDDFIHKTYIHVARKVYKNVYLFEINIPPLQTQKHNRELEIIVQECILNTVRESIPVEAILRAYMDETVEEDVTEEIKEEVIEKPKSVTETDKNARVATHVVSEIPKEEATSSLREQELPLTLETEPQMGGSSNAVNDIPEFPNLEDIRELDFGSSSEPLYSDNKLFGGENDYSPDRDTYSEETSKEIENLKLQIRDQSANLDTFDVHVLDEPQFNLNDDLLLDDIEVLA